MRRKTSRIVEKDWERKVGKGKWMVEEGNRSNNVMSIYEGITTNLTNMNEGGRWGSKLGFGGKYTK